MTVPLQSFDFAVLDDPAFKEDSVREELVAPVLWALGYSATGSSRIGRSTRLEHPYVAIGSIKRQINIFPDYLLYAGGKPRWTLDAKAPWESVDDPDHLSQAYTYAIHRDVRVDRYALCNGRELVVHHVADMGAKPRLRAPLRDLAQHWDSLQRELRPSWLEDEARVFAKDFGLLLLKMGILPSTHLIFPAVPVTQVTMRQGGGYSLMAGIGMENSKYAASFDFGEQQFEQLVAACPKPLSEKLRAAKTRLPAMVVIEGKWPIVNVTARLGDETLESRHEFYRPLVVEKFGG